MDFLQVAVEFLFEILAILSFSEDFTVESNELFVPLLHNVVHHIIGGEEEKDTTWDVLFKFPDELT